MRPLLFLLFIAACGPMDAALAQDGPAAVRARAEGRFIRALTNRYVRDDTAASRYMSEALQLRPNDPAILVAMADAALTLDQESEALYYAERAVGAAPRDASALATHGASLAAAGRFDAALAAFRAAAALTPTDPAIAVELATLFAQRGQVDDARSTLEAVSLVGASPEVDDALRALGLLEVPPDEPSDGSAAVPGVAAFEAGRFAEAADALAAVVDADPRQLDAWAMLLKALAQTSDERAIRYADDAVLLFSSVPSILAPAAEAYLSAGRSFEARSAAEAGLTALAAAGNAPELRERLERALAASR